MSARARGARSTPPVASEAVLKAALGPGKTAEVMRPRSPRCVRARERAQLSCAQLARARLASTAHAHTLCAGQLRGRVASRAAGRVLLRRHRPQGRERQAAPSRRQQVPPQPAPALRRAAAMRWRIRFRAPYRYRLVLFAFRSMLAPKAREPTRVSTPRALAPTRRRIHTSPRPRRLPPTSPTHAPTRAPLDWGRAGQGVPAPCAAHRCRRRHRRPLDL